MAAVLPSYETGVGAGVLGTGEARAGQGCQGESWCGARGGVVGKGELSNGMGDAGWGVRDGDEGLYAEGAPARAERCWSGEKKARRKLGDRLRKRNLRVVVEECGTREWNWEPAGGNRVAKGVTRTQRIATGSAGYNCGW